MPHDQRHRPPAPSHTSAPPLPLLTLTWPPTMMSCEPRTVTLCPAQGPRAAGAGAASPCTRPTYTHRLMCTAADKRRLSCWQCTPPHTQTHLLRYTCSHPYPNKPSYTHTHTYTPSRTYAHTHMLTPYLGSSGTFRAGAVGGGSGFVCSDRLPGWRYGRGRQLQGRGEADRGRCVCAHVCGRKCMCVAVCACVCGSVCERGLGLGCSLLHDGARGLLYIYIPSPPPGGARDGLGRGL